MHVYRLKLEPALWRSAAPTREALAGRLAGDAVIREFAPHPAGGHVASVVLQRGRETHEEALNELLLAAQELGWAFAEAEIATVADRALEMALGFGLTGMGAGQVTQNGEIAVLGAAIGGLVGLIVGANMQKVEVLYRVQLTREGWHFRRVEPLSTTRPALGGA